MLYLWRSTAILREIERKLRVFGTLHLDTSPVDSVYP